MKFTGETIKVVPFVLGFILYIGLVFWYKYYQYKNKIKLQELKVGKGYRIPSEEEFIQGFKFEVKKEFDFGMMYFTKDGNHHFIAGIDPYIEWQPRVVNWKRTEEYKYVDSEGRTIMMDADTYNFLAEPFNVKSFLEQGLIRVKR